MRTCLLLCLIIGCCLGAGYEESEAEAEDAWLVDQLESAARFRLARQAFVAPPHYELSAASELARAEELYDQEAWRDAESTAWSAYKDYRFAELAPNLLQINIQACNRRRRVPRAAERLIDLWYRYPDHPGTSSLMLDTLETAEDLQQAEAAINLSADTPRDVINTDVDTRTYAADILFRFLADHGDYHNIAPRARLGLARSQLILGRSSKDRLLAARANYLEFLNSFPRHPLLFEALCEYALTYLLAYRGDRFDGGALDRGELIINQAELYTEERPERIDLITQYRALIRRWHQDKDISVADWYRRRGHKRAALIYYADARQRDPDSPRGREAGRMIATLENALSQTDAQP